MVQYNNAINNRFLSSYNGPNKVSKNVFYAGDFSTNPWQLGTTFVSPAGGVITADGVLVSHLGTSTYTISKVADAPTVAECEVHTTDCWELQITTAQAVLGAGDGIHPQFRIEGYDYAAIAQRDFTVSFWAKFYKPGIYCMAIANDVEDQNYIVEFTINSSMVWQKITATIPASPSAGAWNYTNGIGLRFGFAICAGTDYYTTPNSWNTGGIFLCTSNQVNGADSTNNLFRIALLQIETGTVATPFEIKSQQQVLRACQRYIQKTFIQGTAPSQGSGSQAGTLQYRAQLAAVSASGVFWVFTEPMRATPTFTYYNPINANANWYNSTVAADSGTPTTSNASVNSVYIGNPQVVGDTVGSVCMLHAVAQANI